MTVAQVNGHRTVRSAEPMPLLPVRWIVLPGARLQVVLCAAWQAVTV